MDDRFDPAKALAGTARYLKLAIDRFGREDLAFVSYHMGMGNLETVLKDFGRNEREARQAWYLIRELRLNQHATIGTPRPVVEYWLHDGHAPDQYRASTVRNLDDWYAAFGVKPGDALYLPPEKRGFGITNVPRFGPTVRLLCRVRPRHATHLLASGKVPRED